MELPPLKSDTEIYSVSCGLQLAVQTMCECSELQHEYRTSLNENTPPVIKVVDFVKHTFFVIIILAIKKKKHCYHNTSFESTVRYIALDFLQFDGGYLPGYSTNKL